MRCLLSSRQLGAALIVTMIVWMAGCEDSKPSDSKILNVEQELMKQIEPPGSFVAVRINHRIAKLSHPAMRIKRVVLVSNRELYITYIAIQGGEEKTEKFNVNAEEAKRIEQVKAVTFSLGGKNSQPESIAVTEFRTEP